DPDTACTGFSRIRRPWYLQGKVNQQVRGVPYCWGCHGSLANFLQRIDAGTMAGNVCTNNAPRADEPVRLGHFGQLGWTSWMAPDWTTTDTYRRDARFHPAEGTEQKRRMRQAGNKGDTDGRHQS